MKDQYVGDINDYLKYALLRALCARNGRHLFVCWMLTPPDDRADGLLTTYLGQAARFRGVDPALFDALDSVLTAGERSLSMIERLAILPGATFDRTPVPIGVEARRRWMSAVLAQARESDIVFFDPDNGLEVPSVSQGRRGSDKYLYWDEFGAALASDASIVVYQHFPRRPREEFLLSLLARVKTLRPEREPFALYTSRVAYVIAPHRDHHDLRRAAEQLSGHWTTHLTIIDP
jgi:hypothetical protein